ncbi:prepilin-type N-terminal cleavage/methylation domain-containing protein [Thomasclavelia cocleata]|uniref:prepilin-type N-terminal cleavage/methylation domain-containing protein n=1 Tax=Thomasclavelia cocleata TaxID=69824 RepID=UPI00242EDB75|nr:prepilin-type N-terminal cleavage/methylation domain-containing protein [Thomasclavelia cocleata]
MANKRFININKRGFTLIEVLFSLSICLLIILNALPIIKTIAYKDKISTNSSNYAIGAKQLAKILYTSKNIVVSNVLSFKDEKEQLYTISLHNNRVVKEPGFDIIIRDVKSLDFYLDNEKIYMQLNNGKKDFHYLIATNYEKIYENDEQIQ